MRICNECGVTKLRDGRCPACDCVARMAPTSPESVDHPPHYGGDTTYEAIKVIEAWGLGFCLGNALKYIARCDRKGSPVEDLEKARWYIDRELQARRRAE